MYIVHARYWGKIQKLELDQYYYAVALPIISFSTLSHL